MACRLVGAKPLPEPMLEILLLGPGGINFSEILIEIHIFSFRKMHFKISSGKWRPLCFGLNVLTHYSHFVVLTHQRSIWLPTFRATSLTLFSPNKLSDWYGVNGRKGRSSKPNKHCTYFMEHTHWETLFICLPLLAGTRYIIYTV